MVNRTGRTQILARSPQSSPWWLLPRPHLQHGGLRVAIPRYGRAGAASAAMTAALSSASHAGHTRAHTSLHLLARQTGERRLTAANVGLAIRVVRMPRQAPGEEVSALRCGRCVAQALVEVGPNRVELLLSRAGAPRAMDQSQSLLMKNRPYQPVFLELGPASSEAAADVRARQQASSMLDLADAARDGFLHSQTMPPIRKWMLRPRSSHLDRWSLPRPATAPLVPRSDRRQG